jgi:hypothetical protein
VSQSYECAIMVGLFFEAIVSTGFDRDKLESMIDDDEVNVGSYYFDSSYDENVVGFNMYPPDSYKNLDPDELIEKFEKLSKKFQEIFGVKPKMYNTLFVY